MAMEEGTSPTGTAWPRRRLLRLGLGGAATLGALAVLGVELVEHGVLPGKLALDQLDGACDAAGPPIASGTTGPSFSGTFRSRARRRRVGYTLAYPPGHGPGSELPLVVMLHGFGGSHRAALAGMSPAESLALRVSPRLAPMALVTVDGGGGYWHPHPRDDPMGMVVDELIPMLRARGLGRPPNEIGAMGISMGGYGAILLAERFPRLVRAVAAISPAIWTTYAEASGANPGAYDSAAQFAAYDAVTHAGPLASTPVRIASGDADPFHPGVVALARVLPRSAVVAFGSGCHTGPFFTAQEPPSLRFLAQHLG